LRSAARRRRRASVLDIEISISILRLRMCNGRIRAGVRRTLMMRRYFPLLLAGLLAAGPGATNAVGQSESGGASLEGSVHSPDGKAVPSASVKITATATGYARTVVTRADGRLVAPLLPVGRYSLEVTANGFLASKRDGVVL